MKSRILALLTAAAITAATFTACANDENTPQETDGANVPEEIVTTAPEPEPEPETATLPVITEDPPVESDLIFDTPSFVLKNKDIDAGENDWFRALVDPWSGNDVTGEKFIDELQRELAKGETRVRVTLSFGKADFTDEAYFDIGFQDSEDGNFGNFGQIRSNDVVMNDDSVTFSVSGQALLDLMEQRSIKKEFGQLYMQIGGLTDEAYSSKCDVKTEVLVGRTPETRLEGSFENLFTYWAGYPENREISGGSYYGYVLHPDDQPEDYPKYEEAIKTPGAVFKVTTNIPSDCLSADTKASVVLGQYWEPETTAEIPADVVYADGNGFIAYEISCDRLYSAYYGLGYLPVGYLFIKIDGLGAAADEIEFNCTLDVLTPAVSETSPAAEPAVTTATEAPEESTTAAETKPATTTAAPETKPATTTATVAETAPATTTTAAETKPATTTTAAETKPATAAGPLSEVPVDSARTYDTSTFVLVLNGMDKGDFDWFDALVDPWSGNDVTGERFNEAFFRELGDGDCTVKVTLSFDKTCFKEGEAWFDIGIQDTENDNYANFEQIRTQNARFTSAGTTFSVSGKDLLNIMKKLSIKKEFAQVFMQIGGLTDEAYDAKCTVRIEVIPGREREKRFSGKTAKFEYFLPNQKVKDGEYYNLFLHSDDNPEDYPKFEEAMKIPGAVLRVKTNISAEYLTLDTKASVVLAQYWDNKTASVVPSDVIYANDDGNIVFEVSCDRLYSAYYGFSYLPVGYIYLRLTGLDEGANGPLEINAEIVTK